MTKRAAPALFNDQGYVNAKHADGNRPEVQRKRLMAVPLRCIWPQTRRSASIIACGGGGQPGTTRSTGMISATPAGDIKDGPKMPPLAAHAPTATTRFGSGIASYAAIRASCICRVAGPTTRRTSACRGVGVMNIPKRCKLYEGPFVCASSFRHDPQSPASMIRTCSDRRKRHSRVLASSHSPRAPTRRRGASVARRVPCIACTGHNDPRRPLRWIPRLIASVGHTAARACARSSLACSVVFGSPGESAGETFPPSGNGSVKIPAVSPRRNQFFIGRSPLRRGRGSQGRSESPETRSLPLQRGNRASSGRTAA